MKELAILAFVLLASMVALSLEKQTFSLMTWNVRGYPESSEHPEHSVWFSSTLAAVAPDVLCVQEIANSDRIAQFIANEAPYLGSAFLNSSDGQDNAIFFGRTVAFSDVPDPEGFSHPSQLASFSIGPFNAWVLTVHLAWTNAEKRAQERRLLEDVVGALLQLDSDVVLAGDLNTTEAVGDSIEGLADSLGMIWVRPENYEDGSTRGGNVYDHILVSPSVAETFCVRSEIVTFDGEAIQWDISDHRPVLATFDLPACPDESVDNVTTEPEDTLPSIATTGDPSAIVINEFSQSPTNAEWVELYNPSDGQVNLGGWTITATHGNSVRVAIEHGTVIAADGFLVITHTAQWLDDSDERLELRNAAGLLIDSTGQARDAESGKSWGRVPDGEGDWYQRSPTKGASNRDSVSWMDLFGG